MTISVLYIDDEPDLLELCKVFLEMNGEFNVDTLLSANKALIHLKSVYYDAIISDYQMPEMDGIQFLKEVRARFRDIPFILFTGRGREEVVIQALNNGADFYLQKGGQPDVQFAELAHKIRQAVGRRNADKRLVESETRFRELTENSLDTIMLFDRNLRFVYVNPNAEKQMGISTDHFIGKTYSDLGFPEKLVDLLEHALNTVFISGKTNRIEFFLPTGFWIDWLLVPVHGLDGDINQIITSGRDVTERKKTEEQVRLAEFSIEHSGIVTFWLDENAKVVRANQAACDSLGYSKDEFANLHVYDFDPNYPPEKWKSIWDQIAKEKYVVIQSNHRRKDNYVFPVEITSSYFEYEGKNLIFSFVRNISDQKQLLNY